MRSHGDWYCLSKTLAEKKANEFVASLGEKESAPFDMVVMNPGFILGPMLQPSLNESSEKIYNYLTGISKSILNGNKHIVDVRDVAEAHIVAYENKASSGRYLLVGCCSHEEEMCDELRSILPTAAIPTTSAALRAPKLLYDASKAERDLGLKFRQMSEMLKATCSSLVQHGFVKL